MRYKIIETSIKIATGAINHTALNHANDLNIGSWGFKTLPGKGEVKTIVKYPNNWDMIVVNVVGE